MNIFRQKGAFLVFLAVLLALSPAQLALAGPGGGHGYQQEVDGVAVELIFKAETAEAGSNNIIIRFENSDHQAVEAKEVTVTVVRHEEAEAGEDGHDGEEEEDHDAQEKAAESGDKQGKAKDDHAKPAEDSHASEIDGHDDGEKVYKTKKSHAAGEYEGKISFSEAGEWEVHISFHVDGEDKEVAYVVEVAPGAGSWLLLGGFFGVNTAIIAAAAVMRSGRSKNSKEISG